jgi:hypothetical protein
MPRCFGYDLDLFRGKDRPVAHKPIDEIAARNHVDGTITRL